MVLELKSLADPASEGAFTSGALGMGISIAAASGSACFFFPNEKNGSLPGEKKPPFLLKSVSTPCFVCFVGVPTRHSLGTPP